MSGRSTPASIFNSGKGRKRNNKERAVDASRKRKRRGSAGFKEVERKVDQQSKQQKRKDPEVLAAHREADKASKKERRKDPEVLAVQRETDKASKKERRKDPEVLAGKREADKTSKQIQRKDEGFRQEEKLKRMERLQSRDIMVSVEEFNKLKMEGPIFTCCCCGGLWFRDSVVRISKLIYEVEEIFRYLKTSEYLCRSCNEALRFGKTPRYALSRGLSFPEIPEELKDLTVLEERLVSLCLPFLQIRCLGADRQCGLRGSVVHIANELNDTVTILPRKLEKTDVIPVCLVRRMEHERPYLFETVRPAKVWEAARYLLGTPVYISHGATLAIAEEEQLPKNSPVPEWKEAPDKAAILSLANKSYERTCGEETVLLNYDNLALKMAPGQFKIPLCITEDAVVEAGSYPTKWAGHYVPNIEELKIRFGEYKKFQMRSYDRRFTEPGIVLHFYSVLLKHRILKSQSTYGRKKKGNKLTAGKILENLEELVSHDYAYRLFHEVRGSPAYWEKKKQHVFALIRQQGTPTFFLTLSAAETYWPELIVMLKKLLDKSEISLDEAEALSLEEKASLVRRDPITCARYFEHRLNLALKLLIKPQSGIFHPGHVADHYLRIEFQHRGSPHAHMLLWVEGCPKYQKECPSGNKNFIDYLDTLISCQNDHQGVIHQEHHHNKTCKFEANGVCRFGFPKFPVPSTLILQPFPSSISPESRKRWKQKCQMIQAYLENHRNNSQSLELTDLLNKLNLSMEEYFQAIRSCLKRPTVMIRRRMCDAFTNAYVPSLAEAWKSNMDLQYIFDPYGAAQYICNYLTKSAGGLSKLMKEVYQQLKGNHFSQSDQMKLLGKTFQNNVEVSTQEAAYFLLGLPLTSASRDCVFIQSGPPSERVFLVKSEAQLRKLKEDSTDVGVAGSIDHYCARPRKLEEWCLADFISWFTFSSIKKYQSSDESLSTLENTTEESTTETYKLEDGTGFVTKRRIQRVMRFVNYGEVEDPNNYMRESLMLFQPWRNETKDILENTKSKYDAFKPILESKRNSYNKIAIDVETYEESDDEESVGEEDEEYQSLGHFAGKQDLLKEIFEDRQRDIVERIPIPTLADSKEFMRQITTLNERQAIILGHILRNLQDGVVEKIFIHGGAGTGKSRLIDVLVQSVTRLELSKPGVDLTTTKVLVMAPTGMAAFNIKGCTVHSALKLPLTQFKGELPLLGRSDRNTLACTLKDCRLVIVDEISMVSSLQLGLISRRLCEIFNTEEDFGGKPVIVLGDLRQLPPVEAPAIYSKIDGLPNRLWESFKSFQLVEIMRQKDDKRFAVALNNLSMGKMTEEEVSMFKGREVHHVGYPEGPCRRLYFKNSRVEEENYCHLEKLNTKKIEACAIDVIQGYGTEKQKNKLLEVVLSKVTKETGALPNVVLLAESANYMLTRNLDTSDGLCNGSVGCLHKFSVGINGEKKDIPTVVWLKFEREEVGRKRRRKLRHLDFELCKQYTPILIEKVPVRCWRSSNLTCVRAQFPLVPAEATTIHKSQGSTLDRVLLNVEGLNRKALYVGCSRARTLAGLFIEGEFKPPRLPVDDKVEMELERLKSKEVECNIEENPWEYVVNLSCTGERKNVESEIRTISNRDEADVWSCDEEPVETAVNGTHPINYILDGVTFTAEDLNSLEPGNTITDGAVDMYFKVLIRNGILRNCVVLTAPVVSLMVTFNQEELKDIAQQIENQGANWILFPFCANNHWILGVAERLTKKITIYNSLYGDGVMDITLLDAVTNIMELTEVDGNWKGKILKDKSQQQKPNTNDCGAFTCANAVNIVQNESQGVIDGSVVRQQIRNEIIGYFNEE